MGSMLALASLYAEEKTPETLLQEYEKVKPPVISGNLIDWRKSRDVTEWLKSRDISEQVADDWGFQYAHHVQITSSLPVEEDEDVSTTLARRRVIVPLHGPAGNLLSVEARALQPWDKIKTLYVKPIDFLFRYHELDKTKPLYVCEGLVDAARLYPVEKNVTYLFGSNLSSVKEHLLKRFSEVVMIPDNDAPGYRLVKSFIEKGIQAKIMRLPDHVEDLGDRKMTNSYIRRWFSVTEPELLSAPSLNGIIDNYESAKREIADVPFR
ncbi:MAG: hypothetical protein LC650_02180 [Actinobacteria bacterium]|nr:hypothetical protein [Actinomycetota bacterium]